MVDKKQAGAQSDPMSCSAAARLKECERREAALLHKLSYAQSLDEYNVIQAERVEAIRETTRALLEISRQR